MTQTLFKGSIFALQFLWRWEKSMLDGTWSSSSSAILPECSPGTVSKCCPCWASGQAEWHLGQRWTVQRWCCWCCLGDDAQHDCGFLGVAGFAQWPSYCPDCFYRNGRVNISIFSQAKLIWDSMLKGGIFTCSGYLHRSLDRRSASWAWTFSCSSFEATGQK